MSMKLGHSLVKVLNTAHSFERCASLNYLYAWQCLYKHNYPGLATFFLQMSKEELSDMSKVQQYMMDRDEVPSLENTMDVNAFLANSKRGDMCLFNTYSPAQPIPDIFKNCHLLESTVFEFYNESVGIALKEGDQDMATFLQSMLKEQLDNVQEARVLLEKAQEYATSDKPALLWCLDQELRDTVIWKEKKARKQERDTLAQVHKIDFGK